MSVWITKDYYDKLSVMETQAAIKLAKDTFELKLAEILSLVRVSAPLFVYPDTGLNDNLSGTERPVSFEIKDTKKEAEIVHSLAKWKRMALKKYHFSVSQGLYTDMNAIRRDEHLDNLHSIYVDQWDWEKVILEENRHIDYLKEVVGGIVKALYETKQILQKYFPVLNGSIQKDVYFIDSEDLLLKYPTLSSKERENAICKEKGTVFIIGIGDTLSNGEPHDLRAPDYDDWKLNGDLLVWYEPLQMAIELSSMGIRVNATSLLRQIEIAKEEKRLALEFHKNILNHTLPLSIGGGIGQSRLCMVLLEKLHIGEVQSSLWSEEDLEILAKNKINIL